MTIGHVGDSRAYRLRDGDLEQLTDDHSLVAELVRSGRLTPEEADAHPQRSVITRAVGTDPDVDVDAFTVPGEPGDVYLLCSDGLTDMVDDGIIRARLRGAPGRPAGGGQGARERREPRGRRRQHHGRLLLARRRGHRRDPGAETTADAGERAARRGHALRARGRPRRVASRARRAGAGANPEPTIVPPAAASRSRRGSSSPPSRGLLARSCRGRSRSPCSSGWCCG